jgi:hypothetical protein
VEKIAVFGKRYAFSTFPPHDGYESESYQGLQEEQRDETTV